MDFSRVFCDAVGKRTNAGDMLVSRQAHRDIPMNQGGTADSVVLYLYLFVLDRVYISVKDVFVLHESSFDGRYKSKELFPVLRR